MNTRRKITVFASLCILAGLLWARTSSVHAWGSIGHQVVAQIAELRLSEKAREAIKKILGEDQFSNEVVVNWADNIRLERKETGSWHYVDIPFEAKDYDPARDGKAGKPDEPKHDIIERIIYFSSVLKDANAKPEAKTEALKFVIHFLGDIHQPLHCAERNGDKGGNKMQVQMPKEEKAINLHKAWDIDLVKHTVLESSLLTYAKDLNGKIKDEDVANWTKGEVKDWAVESHAIAVEKVYGGVPVEGVFQVDEKYIARSKEVIDAQWQKAGVRLAFILNKIFE